MLLKKQRLAFLVVGLMLGWTVLGCQQTEPPDQPRPETVQETTSPFSPISPTDGPETAAEPAPQEQMPDAVVARVNGQEILRSELIRHMHSMIRHGNPSSPQVALDQLISLELLVQEAEKAGRLASEADVEESYQEMALHAGGEASLQQRIEQAGLSVERVKEQLKRELSHRNLVEWKMEAESEISDASVEATYQENIEAFERVRARHILISVDDDATEAERAEALETIEAVAERLEAGEDFAEMAEDVSDDPGSAIHGGDLGYFGPGQMVPPFDRAAFSLEAGQTSDIVETQFGYHLIRVEDKKTLTLDEIKENLRDILKDQHRNDIMSEWVMALRDAAEIEVVTSEINVPAVPGANAPMIQGLAQPPGGMPE